MNITSLLLSQGITDLTTITSAVKSADANSENEEFSSLLNEEVTKLSSQATENTKVSEMTNLIESLDKSILGSVMSSLDKDELAAELVSDPTSAKDVLSMLTSGHMQAIVTSTTNSDEEDTEDSLTSKTTDNLTSNAETTDTTETLAQNLETIIASIGQNVTDN